MEDAVAATGGTREAARLHPHGLHESEARFRNAFVQAALPQALSDARDGRVVAANEEFCRLLGYTEQELLKRSFMELSYPGEADPEELLRSLTAGERDHMVVQRHYLAADGSDRHVQTHVRRIHDDQGEVRYLHALLVDQTAQRRAERALAASEARLRALAEHSEDLVLVVGLDGKIRHAGPNSETVAPFLALPEASLFDLGEPAEAARLRECLTDAALTGATRRVRVRSDCDGRRRNWDVRVCRPEKDIPELDGLVVTLHDVTAQTRAEELAEGEAAILRMVLSRSGSERVLDAVARLLEMLYPELRATILVVSEGGRTLRHGAAPSMSCEYVDAVDGLPVGPGSGVCGTVAFTNEPVIVEDTMTDPLLRGFTDLLRGESAFSCWSLPINGPTGEVVGTFAMYGEKPSRPSPEQWRVAQRMAYLAGLVICGHGARHVRDDPPHATEAPVETLSSLTPRERDVLRLLALGHTNTEIAERLHVGVRTVESQRAHLAQKLGSRARAEFVRAAMQAGLISA